MKRKVNSSSSNALQGHSPRDYKFLYHRLLDFTDFFFVVVLFVFVYAVLFPHTEKEKRVKSGSDGEGASNSQSDSSASLGSLKGGGESCHPSSRLFLPLPLALCVTAIVASGEGLLILRLQVSGQQSSFSRLFFLTSIITMSS